MTGINKAVLENANAAISQGDHEKFLLLCTDDTRWTCVGDKTLEGKQAVRQYIAVAYKELPKFTVDNLIEEGSFLIARQEQQV